MLLMRMSLGDRLLGRVPTVTKADTASAANSSGSSSGSHSALSDSAAGEKLDPSPSTQTLSPREYVECVARHPPTMRIEAMQQSLLPVTTDHYFLCWPAWPIYAALVQHGLMQGTGCPDSN